MFSLASTTCTVYRSVGTTDEFGDPDDLDTIHLQGVPISIIQNYNTSNFFRQDSPTPFIYTYFKGRVDPMTDITVGDRLKDEKTGLLYIVDSFCVCVVTPWWTPDLDLDLRQMT